MKSVFRIYARTTKGNDPYLYHQLTEAGLKPKYEDLLHSFYFNASFPQIFNICFHSLTVENMYIQLGHKFALPTDYLSSGRTSEEAVTQFFRKINFRNYIPVEKGIVENISMNILVRECSKNLPSDNVLLSLLKNHLDREIIMKQYKQMNDPQLLSYYDIKQIVHRKWEHEEANREKEQQQLKLPHSKIRKLTNRKNQYLDNQQLIRESNNGENIVKSQKITYQPHFVIYIRKNHIRLLLKLNKDSLHKHGWRKNIGWAPARESLVASMLYRTGIFQKQKSKVTVWDPFCGSGTIPLIACSMLGSLKIRQNTLSNFIWPHWPIYKPEYLQMFLKQKRQSSEWLKDVVILGSDIDLKSINNSMSNFNNLLEDHTIGSYQKQKNWDFNPADQIFELLPHQVYFGIGDFEKMGAKILTEKCESKSITIVTNLPYLGERSKDHMPLNQLKSVYKRFNKMIHDNKEKIKNVFLLINADQKSNRNHFLRISTEQWRILGNFNNGGIEVNLLGWAHNKDGWGELEKYQNSQNKSMGKANEEKSQYLEQYREDVKKIEVRKYELPKYMTKYKEKRGWKRILGKRKARHLRAAYSIFAKRKDKNQAYEKYARKQLALKLSQRGKSWKRKNMSIIGDFEGKEEIIKKQFENRIEEALIKSEAKKQRKERKTVRQKW